MSNGCDRRFVVLGGAMGGKSRFSEMDKLDLEAADYSEMEELVIASDPALYGGNKADFISIDECGAVLGEIKTVPEFDLTKQLFDAVVPYVKKEETPHQGKPRKFYHEMNDRHNRKKGMR